MAGCALSSLFLHSLWALLASSSEVVDLDPWSPRSSDCPPANSLLQVDASMVRQPSADPVHLMQLAGRPSNHANNTYSEGSRKQFLVVHDTTCSDCQLWQLQQLKPVWEDDAVRDFLLATYDLSFISISVTRHPQGLELNRNLNYAFSQMALEAFVPALFCWESYSVEPWVKGANDEWEPRIMDIAEHGAECSMTLCPQGFEGADCVEVDNALEAEMSAYPELREVPYLLIDGTLYDPEVQQPSPHYELKSFLCEQGLRSQNPSACDLVH